VAGHFYPADPGVLAETVDRLLAAAPTAPAAPGYIVPHAGYRYSGSTASYVYSGLVARRIVLIGPSHFAPVVGAAVPTTRTWLTPLGAVEIDIDGCAALVAAGLAVADDRPHEREHSLEVQLPFLQRALGHPLVLPITVGPRHAADLLAAARADEPGTVVICSTDLSHYLPEREALERDACTLTAICGCEEPESGDACGIHALCNLLGWARKAGLGPKVLHHTTSASHGGDKNRVVGYAALACVAN
jgi:MEMO1 family protein